MPGPGAPDKSSTPLTGAVLSSNWILFETIYDKYERLMGKKWSRDEVSGTAFFTAGAAESDVAQANR